MKSPLTVSRSQREKCKQEIHEIERFATEATCYEAQGIYDALKCFTKNIDALGNPVVHPNDILQYRSEVEFMRRLGYRALRLVKRLYSVSILYLESIFIARLQKNDHMSMHADNSKYDPALGRWVDNHTPWRDYSAILYTSDVEGGELRFEYLDINVKPRIGKLVIFPARREWFHGVLLIKEGIRYSCPMWFSTDKAHEMRKTP